MIYKGTFKDINDNEYTVRIITNGDTASTTNVVLASTPITTDIETSDSHIYKPCKYSSATLRLLTKDYMFDLYASTAQANKVELIDNTGAIKWVGYVTPNLYSMDYENETEQIEIECIDGLSTLQYYKYTPKSGTKSIVNFRVLIDYLLSKCNCYSKYYISNASVLNGTTDSLPSKLYISENNFFDEDGEAMTMQEVLEEICQYLGLTCIADGDKVYFLDYDALKNDYNTYNLFTVGNTASYTANQTLSQTKSVEGVDYAENGGQISLDNVYNKVIVKDSLYTFEEIIPSIFSEDNTNITYSSDTTLSSSTDLNAGAYGEVVVGTNGNTIAFIDKVYDEQDNKYRNTIAVGVQYMRNENYKLYDYTHTSTNYYNYSDTVGMKGAVLAKFYTKKLDKSDEDITSDMEQILAGGTTLEKYLAANEISKFDYSDYLVLLNPSSGHIDNANATSYPYFETTVDNASSLFGGNNAYILISGSMCFNSTKMGNETYPIPSDCIDPSEGRYRFESDSMYLLAKLQWGNQYWNGSAWQTTSCTFKIPFSTDETNPRVDACLLKDINIKNTVTWKTGSDKKGYCIKCPSTYLMNGLPKLTVYKPMDFTVSGHGNYYPTSVMFLKNFSIDAFIGDPTFSDENETDTEYTNVIDEDFVEELEDIEFKICTWDNKAPNYSAVAYKNGSNYIYLDTIYNQGTKQLLRAEEHLIYKLVNQYSTPSVILSLNLHNNIKIYAKVTDKWLDGKTFIVDSISTDWEMNKSTYKLIEKK